jgi:hypothetical protein
MNATTNDTHTLAGEGEPAPAAETAAGRCSREFHVRVAPARVLKTEEASISNIHQADSGEVLMTKVALVRWREAGQRVANQELTTLCMTSTRSE